LGLLQNNVLSFSGFLSAQVLNEEEVEGEDSVLALLFTLSSLSSSDLSLNLERKKGR
jgi:hypothetical protein